MGKSYKIILSLRDGSSGTKQVVRTVKEKAVLIIGRNGSSAHLRVKDPSVSRNHIGIAVVGGRMVVRDLNSTLGTTFQGKRMDGSVALERGAELKFGGSALRILDLRPAAHFNGTKRPFRITRILRRFQPGVQYGAMGIGAILFLFAMNAVWRATPFTTGSSDPQIVDASRRTIYQAGLANSEFVASMNRIQAKGESQAILSREPD